MGRENATKIRIRTIALQLFQERSFEDVTLNEICEKSGVNKHTFYYYFKSKDDLLDQYYDIPYEIHTEDLSSILSADSYVEQFWLLTENMLNYVEKHGVSILRQIFVKNLTCDIGTFRASDQRKASLKAQKKIISMGQACGEFRSTAPPEFLVTLFFQIAISSAIFWTLHNGEFSYKDMVRYSYEMAFDVAPELRKMAEFKIPHQFE